MRQSLSDVLAHSANSQGAVDLLHDHLAAVAARTEQFAQRFDCGKLAALAGQWHDLGKNTQAFQNYLKQAANPDAEVENAPGRVDHSTLGAQFAYQTLPHTDPCGLMLAACIAGHHSGLLDAGTDANRDVAGYLAHRLSKSIAPLLSPVPPLVSPAPGMPGFHWLRNKPLSFQIAFLTRMIFSALVDADYLETERHFRSDSTTQRDHKPFEWSDGIHRVDMMVGEKQRHAADTERSSDVVNTSRRQVYQACCEKAASAPGFFSLTVPTGGGKTLSSLAFALRHAQAHGLDRIIYAMPFTSIIEQNANILREALGDNSSTVLEHHSTIDTSTQSLWAQLACENWDARVIVTTNVQLFESMFANKTSRCRKLHRLARSVIVLDEAQSLPVDVLEPCLAALAELVRNYGATVVLCTATQPAIAKRDDFAIGLENVREIVPDPHGLYEALHRVDVKHIGPLHQHELASHLVETPQVLAIVATRRQAADLFCDLRERQISGIHLSAAMCPAHRSVQIQLIRQLLDDHQPCRVISTQLIEAGVDVDFPVVYRMIAGIDSIAQAAGRCNREGRLEHGQVYIFEPEHGLDELPPGALRQMAQCTAEILPEHGPDLLSLRAVEAYFQLHYWKRSDQWDHHEVMPCLTLHRKYGHDFRTAAEKFRMIDERYVPIVVPYGTQGDEIVSRLLCDRMADRQLLRRAQRYIVTVPEYQLAQLKQQDQIAESNAGIDVLTDSTAYDKELGLQINVDDFPTGRHCTV